MRSRLHVVPAILGAVLLVPALIDPVEGGLPFLVAVVLFHVAAWLSKVPLPRLLWISLLLTFVVGVLTLIVATTVAEGARPAAAVGNWLYRLAVVVSLAGAVLYILRIARSPEARPAGTH